MVDYLRGALIGYDPGNYPTGQRRVIPFRFNPEGLSRSLSVEAVQGNQGLEGAPGAAASSKNEQSADATSGTLKQTFSVTVRLDFVDRLESAVSLDPALGILPEIAALEDLLYPAESKTAANSDGKEPVQARAPRPTVLFYWGTNRILPVRLTQLTVNETLHNSQLNPIRAEVEVAMEVLRDGDARGNQAVLDALNYTDKKRRQLATLFLNSTAAQASSYPTPS